MEGYWLHGTLTNITGDAYDVTNNSFVELVFDDTYTYKGRARIIGSTEAPPLADCSVYLMADMPPRAFENARRIVVRFAFNDNFAEYDYNKGSWDEGNADFITTPL